MDIIEYIKYTAGTTLRVEIESFGRPKDLSSSFLELNKENEEFARINRFNDPDYMEKVFKFAQANHPLETRLLTLVSIQNTLSNAMRRPIRRNRKTVELGERLEPNAKTMELFFLLLYNLKTDPDKIIRQRILDIASIAIEDNSSLRRMGFILKYFAENDPSREISTTAALKYSETLRAHNLTEAKTRFFYKQP